MVKLGIVILICLMIAGCAGTQLKEGGLYVNQSTCVGMDDFGVAKVKNNF